MTFQGDPYRTLGVAPDASLNEIRSAYRRLAKTYHPDTAGERALPRFLSIRLAYEQLVDAEGRLRPRTAWGAGAFPTAAREPWRADPARARASRDAWRARRAAGGSAPGGSGTHGPAGSAGTGTAGSAGTGTAGSDGPDPSTHQGRGTEPGRSRPGGGERQHHRRGPRKATPGSTTYDEAAATPLDPEWDGGAWYGPSSGTYWTINPREYADPRKHGPEYLARARRAPNGERGEPDGPGEPGGPDTPGWPHPGDPAGPGPGDGPAPDDAARGPAPATGGGSGAGRWRWQDPHATATDGGAAEWGTRAWTFDDRGDAGPAWAPGADARARHAGLDRPTGGGADPDTAPLPDLESLARRLAPASLLALARRPGRRWRLLIALIGWPPLGYALGALLSDVTGCASFSASCPEPLPAVLLLAQPLVIAGLYAAPVLAAIVAFAALVAITVAIPVAAVLSVGSLPRAEVEAAVLAVLVLVAYVVGLIGAAIRLWNRPRSADPEP